MTPHGFILSEAALYAFECQNVFPDIISFASAIPDHLKQLFLIPIVLEPTVASTYDNVASKIANTDEADLFGTKTFVCEDDYLPAEQGKDPGSIFEQNDYWNLTKHQEYNYDENDQVPTDTSYMSDIDITDIQEYPYRTREKPVRHSSYRDRVMFVRLALEPDDLVPHTPKKIKRNAERCSVSLVSYDKKGRIFTFSVNCGNGAKDVRVGLSSINEAALSCSCPFWQWNGPEFHADRNKYMLGAPNGTASPPNIRDPDREYWLCKHAYAVLKRLDSFVQDITDENWELDDEELLNVVDKEWDRMDAETQVPLEAEEDANPDLEPKMEKEEPETDESEEEKAEEEVKEAEEEETEETEEEVEELEIEESEPEVEIEEEQSQQK